MRRRGICARCYDQTWIAPANCLEHPEEVNGAIGMYHCPDCGAMVLAGCGHGWLCDPCQRREHPRFDEGK